MTNNNLKGALSLGILLICIFLLPQWIRKCEKPANFKLVQSDQTFQRKVAEFDNTPKKGFKSYSQKSYRVPPRKFNPNDYSINEWMYLGLSEKQAKVILKFAKYRMKSNNDLKKVVVIPKELFLIIQDCTVYDVQNQSTQFQPSKEAKFIPKPKLELNAATESELLELNGIGPFYAKQIIKYRERLGGFISLDQLAEIWKAKPEQIQTWIPQLVLSTASVRKLNINTADVNQFKNHPYFTWNLANSIVKLRTQNGMFKNIEEIKKSAVLAPGDYDKIKPYLKTNE